jgi:hypothetical protein
MYARLRAIRAPGAGVADKRRQDAESAVSIERAKGMDARSERPATGYGSPEAGLGELTSQRAKG